MQESHIKIESSLHGFSQIEYLKNIILSVFEKARQTFPVPDNLQVDVKASPNTPYLKDLQGVGAQCKSPNCVELTLDLTHSAFKDGVPIQEIENSLAHELHHAVRRGFGIDIEKNLLEALLSEGMADFFVWNLFGRRPVWNKKFPQNELCRGAARLKEELNNALSAENYSKWFLFGSKKEGIPRWFGYSLGFELVAKILKAGNDDLISISKIPAEGLLKSESILKILSCKSQI